MKFLKAKFKSLHLSRNQLIFSLTLIFLGIAQVVMAVTAPAAGDFSYEVYDLVVTRVLNGPIGFVAGVGTMAAGAIAAVQNKIFPGLVCMGSGTVLMNAESLVTALGATF